jgi:hypothetical protein
MIQNNLLAVRCRAHIFPEMIFVVTFRAAVSRLMLSPNKYECCCDTDCFSHRVAESDSCRGHRRLRWALRFAKAHMHPQQRCSILEGQFPRRRCRPCPQPEHGMR